MASVQDRLKIKRENCDTWSTREQLCLASSVLKSGDQNWISVSRSLRPFAEKEALRPPDWFSQKSCAIQYAILLENADTPKRKKRESGETTGESIVRRLTAERIAELGQILAFQRDEYQQLKADVNLINSGQLSDEKLQKMWLAIEQEEREQEQKSRAHSAWLAKRQQKSEISPLPTTSKKSLEMKNETAESVDPTNETDDDKKNSRNHSALLTSLLKSSSATTASTTITSTAQVTSPTIASLLGSNTKVHTIQTASNITPQLAKLVNSAMASATTSERPSVGAPTLSMLLALPANLSRGQLPTVPTTPSTDTVAPISVRSSKDIAPVRADISDEIPEIIEQIDDAIGNDKIADVIDKDEINEIIEDIEELIKEEITRSPQAGEITPVSEQLMKDEEKEEKKEDPRNVDESLEDSQESDMAIAEIDSSTSNIAEIIGTTIDTKEPNVIVETITKEESIDEIPEEEKLASPVDKPVVTSEDTPMEIKETPKPIVIEEKKEEKIAEVTESIVDTPKIEEKITEPEVVVPEILPEEEKPEVKVEDNPKETEDIKINPVESEKVKEDIPEEELKEVEKIEESNVKHEEPLEQIEIKSNEPIVQPDTNEKWSDPMEEPEKVRKNSVSSPVDEVKGETPSSEIHDESSETFEDAVEFTDLPKEKIDEEKKEKLETENCSPKEEEDSKVIEKNENIDTTLVTPNTTDETKNTEINKEPEIPKLEVQEEVPKPHDETDSTIKDEPIEEKPCELNKEEPAKEEEKIKEEDNSSIKDEVSSKKKDEELTEIKKEEPSTSLADDLDIEEEESSLTKHNAGRAMKTYSKKQNVAIDSEPETESSGEGADYRAWKKAVMLVYNRLATHKNASLFLRPITEDHAPGYHSVIFRPMDLWTIKKNIDNGTIRSTMHFQRDVMLMFQNAQMYNKRDTDVYQMAISMQEDCIQQMQILLEATGEVSFRRETRTAASSSSETSESSGIKRKRSHITPSPLNTESPRLKKRRKSEND